MSFGADLKRFAEKTGIRGDILIRKVCFDALRGVMEKSPVDTGRFRASWNVGINRVDLSVAPEMEVSRSDANPKGDPPPLSAVDQGKMNSQLVALQSAGFGDTIYISNNLPYAEPLERGHSKQAPGPGGIARRTVLEIKANIRANLAALG